MISISDYITQYDFYTFKNNSYKGIEFEDFVKEFWLDPNRRIQEIKMQVQLTSNIKTTSKLYQRKQ